MGRRRTMKHVLPDSMTKARLASHIGTSKEWQQTHSYTFTHLAQEKQLRTLKAILSAADGDSEANGAEKE